MNDLDNDMELPQPPPDYPGQGALAVTTGSLLRVWKSEYGTPAPVEKWCEKRGWPNRTTEGEIMYENVFFADLAKAWERHIAEHEAGFEMDAGRVKQAKADLSAAIAAVADAAILMCDVKLAHADFLKANAKLSDASDASLSVGAVHFTNGLREASCCRARALRTNSMNESCKR